MKFGFKDIEETKVYDGTLVMFIYSKYNWFSNCVIDTLKYVSNKDSIAVSIVKDSEFGLEDSSVDNNVDIETFVKVANVKNMSGKWMCRIDIDTASSKQIETVKEYIKKPSKEALLCITGSDYKKSKEFLMNKVLNSSLNEHIITLNFAYYQPLTRLVRTAFTDKGLVPDNEALELFIRRVNTEYDEIPSLINSIRIKNGEGTVTFKDMKAYLRGVEYYNMNDLVDELVRVTSKAKKKRLMRILTYLIETSGAESVAKELLNVVNSMIRFREIINNGTIPIKIYSTKRYPFNSIVKELGEAPESKLNEHVFYRRAVSSSLTNIGDWIQMKFVLESALNTSFEGSPIRIEQCYRALVYIVNRQVFTESRRENMLKIDDIIEKEVRNIDDIEVDSINKST